MADPRKPFAPPGSPPEMDPASSFLDRLGIVRPRTGPAGVSRNTGVGSVGALPPLGNSGVVKPPAVNSAPPGRPSTPTGFAPPPAAPAPPPAAAQPAAQAPQPAAPPVTPGAEPAAPAAQPQQLDSQGRAFTAPRIAVPKMPSRLELEQMDPNAIVDSPYGQLVTNPETGKRELQFTPEGKQRYGAEVQRLRSKLGPNPFRNIPGAPEMEIEPGKPVFDAFSGRWVS